MGAGEALNDLKNIIVAKPGTAAAIAGGTVLAIGAGTALAVAGSRKKKSTRKKTRSRRKRKKTKKKLTARQKYVRKIKKRKGRQSPYTAGARKDRSRRRIRYTKNGQPYVLMASGKARFIKKSSAKRSRKLKGGRY